MIAAESELSRKRSCPQLDRIRGRAFRYFDQGRVEGIVERVPILQVLILSGETGENKINSGIGARTRPPHIEVASEKFGGPPVCIT